MIIVVHMLVHLLKELQKVDEVKLIFSEAMLIFPQKALNFCLPNNSIISVG